MFDPTMPAPDAGTAQRICGRFFGADTTAAAITANDGFSVCCELNDF